MRISTKIISVAASVALVAGAGALAAAPAQAASATLKGESTLAVPAALAAAAAAQGITFGVEAPAKVATDGSTGFTNFIFPVAGPIEDGVIRHKGVLTITSAKTKATLTLTDPTIEFASDGSDDTGTLGGTLNGLPAFMAPFDRLNGTFVRPFDLTNFERELKFGKVRKAGKSFTRVDTVTVTADVFFDEKQESANIFNTALLGPGGSLFTPGMAFGELTSKYTITVRCKTSKQCKA